MRTGRKKLLLGAAGLVLLGYVLYRSRGVLHLSDFSGGKLWAAIRSANPLDILLALFLIYGCYALRAMRWQVFQKNLGKAHFWQIYRMTLAGFAAVFLLARFGEPIRPLLLARKAKLPIADTLGIYVLERLFDIASTVVIAAIALLVYSPEEHGAGAQENAARTAGVFLALGVAAAIGVLVYLRVHGTSVLERRLRGWLASAGLRARIARIVLGFVRGIQIVRTWRDLAEAVSISVLHWYFVVLVYVFVSHAFGGKLALLSVGDCMLIAAFALVGSIVQLPTVGGGFQAAVIFAYTKIFGVENELALVTALVLYVVTFGACTLAGIPLLVHEGLSLGKLLKMAEHEKEELAEEAVRGVTQERRGGDA